MSKNLFFFCFYLCMGGICNGFQWKITMFDNISAFWWTKSWISNKIRILMNVEKFFFNISQQKISFSVFKGAPLNRLKLFLVIIKKFLKFMITRWICTEEPSKVCVKKSFVDKNPKKNSFLNMKKIKKVTKIIKKKYIFKTSKNKSTVHCELFWLDLDLDLVIKRLIGCVS